MVPWALWSLIYGAAKLFQALIGGTPLAAEFAPYMAVTGLSVHLWFLPFTFAALALAPLLRAGAWWHVPLLLAGVLVVMRAGPYPMPFAQWAHVLPAAVLGIWMRGSIGPVWPVVILLVLATGLWQLGFGRGIEQSALASALCLLALLWTRGPTLLTRHLAPLAFGVYLTHPLVIALLMLAGFTDPWILLILTLPLSAALSAVLRRYLPVLV